MSLLSISLLGSPHVRHGGRPLAFRTRKELALLVYLAVEGGTHSREKLAALLWPASGERRAALRNALAGVRIALEEPASAPADGAHLLAERDSLGLRMDSGVEGDFRVVQEAFALTREPAERLRGDARGRVLERFEDAAGCYRGEFLEGFYLGEAPEFDYWLDLQREAWRRRVNEISNMLSQLRLEGGEIAGAFDTASEWMARDPLNEAACRRLMQAQFSNGDGAGALRTFEACRSYLMRSLGREPEPVTQALAERIRAKEHPPTRRVTGIPTSSGSPPVPFLPFTGREDEMNALVGSYHVARRDGLRVAVVAGEAGIGKTRLAEEFLLWVRSEGADVLRGRAFETGGVLPYQPLVAALRPRIQRERAPDDLLDDVWLSELSRLLPELRERYPDLPPPSAGDEARGRLYEAVAQLGEEISELSPMVVFLDDLHWADTASLDVLGYAARRWMENGRPILLLLGVRSEALNAEPRLEAWLSNLYRDLPVGRLSLDTLARGEVLKLVRTLAKAEHGSELTEETLGDHRASAEVPELEEFGEWLYAETEGQPLFLAETMKVLLNEDFLNAERGSYRTWKVPDVPGSLHSLPATGSASPPSGVWEVIRARIARVGTAASKLLAAAAILGQEPYFERLHRVAGLSEEEGLAALDEVVRGRLMREVADENPSSVGVTYAFGHDKIRNVVYAEAGAARRRVLHRRALGILEEAGAPAAELARHAYAGGLPEPAFLLSLEAGDTAMSLLAGREAIAHYERARGIVDAATGQSREHERLYVNLARARELVGEWEEARSIYEEMRMRGQQTREHRLEWAALDRLAILAAQRSSDLPEALALLEEALEAAKRSGDPAVLAETEWNLAQMNALNWETDVAIAHGERSLVLARELDLKELEARSLYVLGASYAYAGRWEECALRSSEAAELCEALGDRTTDVGILSVQSVWAGSPPSGALSNRALGALSLSMLALGEIHRGFPKKGVQAARTALDISSEIDNRWALMFSTLQVTYGSLELGEYAEALRISKRGLEAARTLRNPTGIFRTLTNLGCAYQAMLRLEEARSAFLEALMVVDTVPVRPWKITIVNKLCANRVLAGDWEGAYRYALESIALREVAPTQLIFMDFERHHQIAALLRGGDVELARQDVRRFGEQVYASRRFRVPYLCSLAVLARWDGETADAIERLRDAETLAKQIGLPGELWQIRVTLGELYEQSGERQETQKAFTQAAETFRKLTEKLEDHALLEGFGRSPLVRQLLRWTEHDSPTPAQTSYKP